MLRDFGELLAYLLADELGHLAGSAGDGVGVVVLAGADHEVGLRALIAQALEPVECGRGHVQQGHVLFFRDLLHRGGIVAVMISVENAVLEMPAGDGSQQNRPGALFFGGPYEETQVVLIGPECRSIARGIILLGIVVAELDEQVIPRLQVGFHLIPKAQVPETLGAAPVLGIVDDLHSIVQEVLEHHSPAAFGPRLRKVLLRHCGISDGVDGER